ncbi:MAG: 50S ribosomal protein L3 [Candidatus Sericytochromatia bacterium]|nr:50S ribosomal protein L3 [Candidatus Sericytochromatia bacterium]
MALGILGKKLGMTQIYDELGNIVVVTVVQAGPCPVTQVKTEATDGYNALQLGFDEVKAGKLNKPEAGHLAKAKVAPQRHLREFRLSGAPTHAVGDMLTAEHFTLGQQIDVVGQSIGKGTMGIIRRFHAGRGPMAHGSKFHRHNGSIGAGTTPGRVYKGTMMPGRMGNERVTVRNLKVAGIDIERNLILIKGAVPGVEGGLLIINPANRVGYK